MATETHFQKELEALKENLLKMAAVVEEAIRNSVQSLVKRDLILPGRHLRLRIELIKWNLPSMTCVEILP